MDAPRRKRVRLAREREASEMAAADPKL